MAGAASQALVGAEAQEVATRQVGAVGTQEREGVALVEVLPLAAALERVAALERAAALDPVGVRPVAAAGDEPVAAGHRRTPT